MTPKERRFDMNLSGTKKNRTWGGDINSITERENWIKNGYKKGGGEGARLKTFVGILFFFETGRGGREIKRRIQVWQISRMCWGGTDKNKIGKVGQQGPCQESRLFAQEKLKNEE